MSGHAYSRAFRASSVLLFTFLDDNLIRLNEIDNVTSNLLHGELDSASVSKSDDMLSMADAITGIIDTSYNDNRIVAHPSSFRIC